MDRLVSDVTAKKKTAKKVVILRGLPGAGKSTFTAGLDLPVVSADHYFLSPEGEYVFRPEKLPEAHGQCFRRAVEHASRGEGFVVDNTNLTAVEVAPYVALAGAYGLDHEIISVVADPEVAFRRQRHGVPRATFERMRAAFEGFHPMPWWKHRVERVG